MGTYLGRSRVVSFIAYFNFDIDSTMLKFFPIFISNYEIYKLNFMKYILSSIKRKNISDLRKITIFKLYFFSAMYEAETHYAIEENSIKEYKI